MEHEKHVTLPSEGPTESVRGETLAKPATAESKPRKRVSLRQASLEAAVRLLCALYFREPGLLEVERLESYAKDGF